MNVTQLAGIAGITLKVTADDTSNELVADGSLPMSASVGGQTGAGITSLLITVETNSLRFGHGITVSNSSGHILYETQSLLLDNPASIRSFRYINETNSSNCVFYMTPYYGRQSAK